MATTNGLSFVCQCLGDNTKVFRTIPGTAYITLGCIVVGEFPEFRYKKFDLEFFIYQGGTSIFRSFTKFGMSCVATPQTRWKPTWR